MSQDIKVEYSKDMQSLRKKNQAEILEIKSPLNKIKNTVESLSSKREKVEGRISGVKHKIYTKEKTEEFLGKRLTSYVRTL
jgi:chromosome segregation ATPase